MKTFKLHYEKWIVALSFLALVICIGGFVLNGWRFLQNGGFTDFYSSITYIIVAFVMVFAPILLLTVVFHSYYTVSQTEFTTNFGFIRSKFAISEMTELVYNVNERKLAIYTGEEFMVFRLDKKWDKQFIDALMAANKRLIYNETEEEDTGGKKVKKDDDQPKK